jgi:hypothetical protein
MIGIFYHPKYWERKKRVLFTKSIKYSKFLPTIAYFSWKFNIVLSNSLITSGPAKLVNNTLITYKKNKQVAFNNFNLENFYVMQYDEYGQKIVQKILASNSNANILIGPLYNDKQLRKLVTLIANHKNIKLVTASESVRNAIVSKSRLNISTDKITTLPVGVCHEAKVNKKSPSGKIQCLVYFKKRQEEELKIVTDFLSNKRIEYKIFKYGQYKNKDLLSFADDATFGIILDKTESQGIAIQEIMSRDLPLIISEYTQNFINGYEFEATSVPFWSDGCGIKIERLNELDNTIDEILQNLAKFNPGKYINENLTYSISSKSLIKQFTNI